MEDLLPGQTDEEGAEARLQEKIHEISLKEKEDEIRRQAGALGRPYINLIGFAISPESLTTVSQEEAGVLKTVCFLNNGREIRLGALDYTKEVREKEAKLAEKFHAHASTYLISKHSFQNVLNLYDNLPKVRKFVSGVEITQEDLKKFEKEILDFRDLD